MLNFRPNWPAKCTGADYQNRLRLWKRRSKVWWCTFKVCYSWFQFRLTIHSVIQWWMEWNQNHLNPSAIVMLHNAWSKELSKCKQSALRWVYYFAFQRLFAVGLTVLSGKTDLYREIVRLCHVENLGFRSHKKCSNSRVLYAYSWFIASRGCLYVERFLMRCLQKSILQCVQNKQCQWLNRNLRYFCKGLLIIII